MKNLFIAMGLMGTAYFAGLFIGWNVGRKTTIAAGICYFVACWIAGKIAARLP